MTVVIGVAGSGNRSRLRCERERCVEPELSEGPAHIWHFGEHDEDIARYDGPAHIPVRNPVDVMLTWLNRGKPLADLFNAMERMAAYSNPQTTVLRTEDLPIRVGHVEHVGPLPDRETLRRTLLANVSDDVMQFYKAHGDY